jgi:hypothetical protein
MTQRTTPTAALGIEARSKKGAHVERKKRSSSSKQENIDYDVDDSYHIK